MKILRVIPSASPSYGGPIEGALRIGQALAQLGHEQHLATLDPPDAAFLADVPATVIPLGDVPRAEIGPGGGRPPLWRRFGYAPRVRPWLRANAAAYDVIIVSGIWSFANLAARFALPGRRPPYVVFTHGMLDPWFRERYPRKHVGKQLSWLLSESPLLHNAEYVLFTSEEERLRARGAFWPYHVREEVVSYGTADVAGDPAEQIAAFHARLPALDGRRFLLFLSRIHEKKGCDLLVDAFAMVAASDPGLDLVIAGPDEVGLRVELERRAAAAGVQRRIHWPGMLKGAAKTGAFRACEAFVLPSHQENFGISIAEAMACARPVLITDKINIWREIEADGAGLVEPDDGPGVRRLLERFLALPGEERRTMGERARASFLARFHIDEAARSLVSVLERAIAGRR